MSSRKIAAAVVALSVALSLPAFAAQPNGVRNRETREEERFGNREERLFVQRLVRAVRKGVVRVLDDCLTVPRP